MPTRDEQLAALIQEITIAFEGVSRENGVSLSEAWVIDDYGSDEERALARARDKDERWQKVSHEDIFYGYSCLSFFDDIGLRYYFPAYMVWTLRNFENTDSNTPESVVSFLTLSSEPEHQKFIESRQRLGINRHIAYEEMHEWTLERFAVFTPQQSRAIAHFLQFLAEHDKSSGARKALTSYWDKFV